MDEDEAGDRIAAAAVALGHLADAAAGCLAKLQQPAVAVADPDIRDTWGDSFDWLAVQLGLEEWELRTGYGTLNLPTRDDLATACGALMFLEQAKWRELAATAFERPQPPAAAVVVQHGARWLVVDNRWVFLIGPSAELMPVGEMYGFTTRLGKPNPVLLDIIEPDAWDSLSAAMPGFPVETLVREGLTPAQQKDFVARHVLGAETPAEIGRSYNLSAGAVLRLSAKLRGKTGDTDGTL